MEDASSQEWSDTLRVSHKQLAQLYSVLDKMGGEGKGEARRQRVRHTFREGTRLMLSIDATNAVPERRFRVASNDISETGVSILNGTFIHPGSQCMVVLQQTDGTLSEIRGRVVRCRHVMNHVHEIGVQFDEPIDIHLYLLEE